MVGLGFALVGTVIEDFETQYPNVSVSENFSKYDYSKEINESMGGLKKEFDIIGDEDIGWFSKIAAGITAIPKAIIAVPVTIFQTMRYGISIFSSVGSDIFKIPEEIINFGVVALFIIIIFALVSFWHRSKA
ncbi:unnamed protein product [marine sediment metagenome]|uniref:Uncharacterized protein n=1 Tax=marine sediment metagenome TaxID=412755 RepID=X0T4E2_9ZZZZ